MIKLNNIKFTLSIISLVMTSCLMYFSTNLHGDAFFPELIVNDLFYGQGKWQDWVFPPAPAYFDIFLYLISSIIFQDMIWRMFFTSIIEICMVATCTIWLAKQIYSDVSKHGICLILLALALVNIMSAHVIGFVLYSYKANFHFSSFLFSLLGLNMIIKFCSKPNFLMALGIIFIGVIAEISSQLFIVQFILPVSVFACFGICIFRMNWKYTIKLLYVLTIMGSIHVFYNIVFKIITYNDALSSRQFLTIKSIKKSIKIFLATTREIFSFNEPVFLIAGLFILFLFSYILYKLYFILNPTQTITENKVIMSVNFPLKLNEFKIPTIIFFMIMLSIINISGVVISGGFHNAICYTYFSFPIALIIIISIILLDKTYLNYYKIQNICFFFIYAIITILTVNIVISKPKDIFKQHHFNTTIKSTNNCIDDLSNNEFVPQGGLSSYHLSKGINYFSNEKYSILAIADDLSPLFWFSSLREVYELAPLNHPDYLYNFIIFRRINGLSESKLSKILPKPFKIVNCSNKRAKIWLYNDKKLDSFVKASKKLFLLRRNELILNNLVEFPASLFLGEVGQSYGESGRIAVQNKDKPGFLINNGILGYIEGQTPYNITIKYTTRGNIGTKIGKILIGQFSQPGINTLLYEQDIIINDQHQISANIKSSHALGHCRFEVKVWFDGSGELSVKSIGIKKI